MKKWLYNFLALGVGILLALILAEIVLRIYNPFVTRVRGNEIVLPANVKYEFKNVKIPGLNSNIIHTKNSLGFRGPELPPDDKEFRIFCVGGSTTECFYLNDGKDWPALLMKNLNQNDKKVWVNNAGLDGHSTRGHLILLKDHLLKFKPDMVVFLVGCNDVASDGMNKYENYHLNNRKRFLENFEVFNAWLSWKRSRNAKKMGLGHKPVDFTHWETADTTGWKKVLNEFVAGKPAQKQIDTYGKRLLELAEVCEMAGAIPVFVTQPSMLCNATDPVSQRYLGNMKFQGKSALEYRAVLDKYNLAAMELRNTNNKKYTVIDAANQLPASSNNFYDFFHYTLAGSQLMADIIGDALLKTKLIP
jgi:lysophospholipase L1-like esterase